jgi:hypothetical protein
VFSSSRQLVANDDGRIVCTIQLEAPINDSSMMTVLLRAQSTGMIALRNVER